MKEAVRLFMILLLLVVVMLAWITGRLGNPGVQLLIAGLIVSGFIVFVILNILESSNQKKRRKAREEAGPDEAGERSGLKKPGTEKVERGDNLFRLREQKKGLSWSGGNIHASEAHRGTKRKFLGR